MSESKLNDLLKKENILIRVNADTWERAVRIGGALLVQDGCVEEKYVDATVQMVAEMGPHIVISPGLAICYAGAECGVNRMGMSLITLEKSIHFGNICNDPVKTIVFLAAMDDISYSNSITIVVRKIQDSGIEGIVHAEKREEIIKLLH